MASRPITMEPAEVRGRLEHLLGDVEARVMERCNARIDALRVENASLRRTNRQLNWIIRIVSVLSAAAMLAMFWWRA
jgi:hypothetical protein